MRSKNDHSFDGFKALTSVPSPTIVWDLQTGLFPLTAQSFMEFRGKNVVDKLEVCLLHSTWLLISECKETLPKQASKEGRKIKNLQS